MVDLPSPFRAALGLAATALDEAKRLPDRAIELPMLAVSQALQLSLRAQQRYAALEARGDEVLAARAVSDEPPSWATFDEPVAPATPASDALAEEVVETAVLIEEAELAADLAAETTMPADESSGPSTGRRPRPNKTVRPPRGSSASAFDQVREPDDPFEPPPGE